jgi:molybdate transport repressor ModE-like protein
MKTTETMTEPEIKGTNNMGKTNKGGSGCLIGRRLFLLQKIDELGSITKAAKEVGISYQTALTTINMLNSLAARPLVSKKVGGKKGGGTQLTIEGRLFLNKFLRIWMEHQQLFHGSYLGVTTAQECEETCTKPPPPQ